MAVIKWDLTQRTGRLDAETEGLNMSPSTYYDVCRAQEDTGWKWIMQASWTIQWHWFNRYKPVKFRDLCLLFRRWPLGRWTGVNSSWCLGCTLSISFGLLFCFAGCARGYLSKSHLLYNLWVRFHLILTKIRMFYRLTSDPINLPCGFSIRIRINKPIYLKYFGPSNSCFLLKRGKDQEH